MFDVGVSINIYIFKKKCNSYIMRKIILSVLLATLLVVTFFSNYLISSNPISVSSFRLQPLGFSRDVHAFIPSGANAGSGIAWFVTGIVFLIF